MQHAKQSRKSESSTQRVLGRILAQSFSGEQQSFMKSAAGAALPSPGTAHVVHSMPWGFSDGVQYDGGAGPR